MPETPPRRRTRAVNQPEGKTHDEIYQLIEQSASKAEQAWQATAKIEEMLTGLTKAIGSESQDEYGQPVGTGIVGRLMRLERDVQHRFVTLERDVASRFGKYDGWVKMLTGAAVAIGIIGPVLWWLVGDRLALLLK
ncbi:MAG: hypothetical protein IOD05_16345 [Rhodobacter sp.]|nr:hypothetical protein [Rhodobacter sp.]